MAVLAMIRCGFPEWIHPFDPCAQASSAPYLLDKGNDGALGPQSTTSSPVVLSVHTL